MAIVSNLACARCLISFHLIPIPLTNGNDLIYELYIKNMVCDRCKMAVRQELEKAKVEIVDLTLGEVEVAKPFSERQLQRFTQAIAALGFELIEDKTARIISRIKSVVIEYVHHSNKNKSLNFSIFLTEKLNKDYSMLSNVFSEVEGITIEQYLIRQKTERTKELLVYDELSIQQIADQLGYSSVQHLSTQFKKVTGLTPSHFRKIGNEKRNTLDRV